MKQSTMYKNTAERLKKYNLFSDETIHEIASFAQKQAAYKTYQDFFKEVGVPEVIVHRLSKKEGVPVVDIPSKLKNSKGVLVIHLPMANSLDTNQLYQTATIAASNPGYRVIAFGNPSGKPYSFREQNLTFIKRFNVAFRNKLQPLVAAELDYLHKNNIKDYYQIGYSYGALKAMITSIYDQEDNVKDIILLDPVAHPRYPQQLAQDFKSTFEPMGEYVNRTNMQTYFDARSDAVKQVDYNKGLIRQINLAVGMLLARSDFIKVFENVLEKQPKITALIAWASKSEIGNDAHMKVSMHRLSGKTPKIKSMRLEGDRHSFANDIHLYAAIIHEAIHRRYYERMNKQISSKR